ncbi:hypothetical protein [Bordetella genomosp. 11]|uniref:Uncharacterized protein n=1 Tax=Bordetella genomosp. 11 TaxID=1416808 RepID=A0A261UJH9_9BORD|nr:hypothetical protein [Bordetella genomosp. 11]OZI62074.1 hypothetical protein CAL28_22890 [Bordetella genomosp. 11]
MPNISASTMSGMAMQSSYQGGTDLPSPVTSAAAVLRAMAEAEQLLGEAALKENARDMKESMMRRGADLQKRQASVYESCEKEMDGAWWRCAGRTASSVLSMLAGGITLGSVAGSANQMSKASADGSITNMSAYTPRGQKLDSWNRVGQSGQYVQQGLGGLSSAIGDKNGTEYDVQKKYQDLEGQLRDSDAQLSMDILRRRNGDVSDAAKRVEKVNDMRLEYLRAAVRTLA